MTDTADRDPASVTAAREGGFALVAALLALVLFAFLALAVVAQERGVVGGVAAQAQRARLEAAADGGLAIVVAGLTAGEGRWRLDGRPHPFAIDAVQGEAAVEDARGLVPVNGLTVEQARRLFGAAGLAAAPAARMADTLLNWQDGAERPGGARQLDYAAQGVHMRGARLRTVGELAALQGMTPELMARLAPLATAAVDASSFDPATASPVALAVMKPEGADTPDALVRARERAGEQAALDAGPVVSYVARPLEVRVWVRDDAGGAFARRYGVVLTGRPSAPFFIRSVE